MAVAEQTIITCDKAGHNQRPCGKPATTYTVSGPDGSWSIDLCDQHAEPVWGLAVKLGRVATKPTGRRTIKQATRPFLPDR